MKFFILKAKKQIISLYNAQKLFYIHEESGSGRYVVSMSKTKLSNLVFLKKADLGIDQETKWRIISDEENTGWYFIQESESGQYLRARTRHSLTTDGMYLV